jgi:tRNA (cytidine56-2'-O)-methyltransferase
LASLGKQTLFTRRGLAQALNITVLRLGHRPERDKRITTHVCLTARALGCERVVVTERDDRVVEGVNDVVKRFGGPFTIESGVPYRPLLKNFQGTKVHLTMYGLPMQEVVPQVPKDKDLLVVVGAEKVPRDVYELVDFNVAVGNQPHSEVAALALFLYSLQGDAAFSKQFVGEIEVEPSARGKVVRPKPGPGKP